MDSNDKIKIAQQKLLREFSDNDNINGIGIGKSESGKFILVVMMVNAIDTDALPKSIDGFDIEYKVVGTIRAL